MWPSWIGREFPIFVKILQILSYEFAFFPSCIFGHVITAFSPDDEDEMFSVIRAVYPEITSASELAVIGCGTVGRVYRWKDLAIKVQIPGMVRRFHDSFHALSFLLRWIDWATSRRHRFYDRGVYLMASFRRQFDFEEEARSLQQFEVDLRRFEIEGVRTPRVHYASPTLLVMDYVEGRMFRREDTNLAVAQMLIGNIFLFEKSHTDLHAGNMIVGANGEVYVIDFGIMADTSKNRRFERLVRCIMTDDVLGCAECVLADCRLRGIVQLNPWSPEADDLRFLLVRSFHIDASDNKIANMASTISKWFSKYPHVRGAGQDTFHTLLCSVHFIGFVRDPAIQKQALEWYVVQREKK